MKPITELTKEDIKDLKLVCFDVDGVTVKKGTDIQEVRDAIDKNAEALLIFSQDGFLQTHPLIRDYFWSRAYESGIWKQLTERYGFRAREKLKKSGLSDGEMGRFCFFFFRVFWVPAFSFS